MDIPARVEVADGSEGAAGCTVRRVTVPHIACTTTGVARKLLRDAAAHVKAAVARQRQKDIIKVSAQAV